MELTYTKVGDYLIPDLVVDRDEEIEVPPLGKYGRLREHFLKERHHGTYISMLLTGRLESHLREIDQQVQDQVDRIVAGLKQANGVNEAMKAGDQLGWVQAVNSFIAQAEEQVLSEIVYR